MNLTDDLPLPERSPTYYAVYFEAPDGLKLEAAHS